MITSALTLQGKVGVDFSYQIAATNGVVGFSASSLPPGITLAPASGILSGKPTQDGTFTVPISAYNATDTGYAQLSALIRRADSDVQPGLVLQYPYDGLITGYSDYLSMIASVDDPDNLLVSLQLIVDGAVVATFGPGGPFTAPFFLKEVRDYVFEAVATDSKGRVARSKAVVHGAAVQPAAPPKVYTPLSGLSLPANGTVNISAEADSSASAPLQSATIYADGQAIATFDGHGAPENSVHPTHLGPLYRQESAIDSLRHALSASFPLSGLTKNVNLYVVSTDTLGRQKVSDVVSFRSQVTNDLAPKVSIDSAIDGTQVQMGSTHQYTVTATDPDAGPGSTTAATPAVTTVAKVEFFANGASVGQAVSPPFLFPFKPAAAGNYVLHAVATDGGGLASVSDPVRVEVISVATVSITVKGSGAAGEGGPNAKFLLSRSGGDLTQPLTVVFQAKGSAKNGADYNNIGASSVIPANQTSVKLVIKPIDNRIKDGARVVTVKLVASSSGDYNIGAPKKATVTILDND